MKRIYFIDSENVGDSWLPLLVREEDEILVFYTSKSPYMSYDGLVLLKESPKEVTFIKCFEGTNALDFQLCSELGYRLNSETADEFIIITNDTGYDAAVRYWQKKEFPVRRVQSKMVKTLLEVEKTPAAKEEEKTAEKKPQDRRRSRAAERVDQKLDEKVTEAGRERKHNAAKPEEEAAQPAPAEESVGIPAEAVKKNADSSAEAPAQAEGEADPAEATPKKPSRRELWKQRQQQRRQKQKEVAQTYAEKAAELIASADQKTTEETAEKTETEEKAETAEEAVKAEAAKEIPAPAIIKVETRSSGVMVVPPAFYEPAKPEIKPVSETAEVTAEKAEAEAKPVETETVVEEAEVKPVEAENVVEEAEPAEAVEAAEAETVVEEAETKPEEAAETETVVEEAETKPEEAAETETAVEETGAKPLETTEAETVVEESEKVEAASIAETEVTEVTETVDAKEVEAVTEENVFPKEEVDTIINCIGRSNLGDIHNSLELFYGEQGKGIYQKVKSASYELEEKKWNRERKFRRYCSVIFAHSDMGESIPEDFVGFLFRAADKRKNLNSLRAALQNEYGKDLGMRLYSVVKAHIKVLNKM